METNKNQSSGQSGQSAVKSNQVGGLELIKSEQNTIAALIHASVPSITSHEEAQRLALKEISNAEMLVQKNPALLNCNGRSFLQAVKQCLTDGLTIAPSAGLVYLLPERVKIGQNGNQDVYEWVVSYMPTANGKLSIAYQSGSILDHKQPYFTFYGDGKLESVTVEFLVPSFPQPRWEKITYGITHFTRWMNASAKKNKGNPNPNYTSWNGSIDPEFAATKAIKHGLNKRGTNLNFKRPAVINLDGKLLAATAIEKERADVIEEITTTESVSNNGQFKADQSNADTDTFIVHTAEIIEVPKTPDTNELI